MVEARRVIVFLSAPISQTTSMRAPGSFLVGVHPLHTFASRPTTGRLRGRGNKQDKRVHRYDGPGAAAFS